MIYFDNAATSWPKPEVVYKKNDEFFRNSCANPGRASHIMSVESAKALEECRLMLSKLFNCPEKDRIVFTFSTTDSLNMVINGLLNQGDHVITTTMEHNSVVRPLEEMRKKGVEISYVQCNSEGFVSPSDIKKQIKINTKLICINHVSNVTGTIQPVNEICAIARENGINSLVDGAQAVGVIPVDINEIGADFYAFPGHKGLFGPTGTGGLVIPRNTNLRPFRRGGTGSHSEEVEQPALLPYRYESGTMNVLGIAGLLEGVKFIMSEGIDTIRKHEECLVKHIIEGLGDLGQLKLYGPENLRLRTSVISFNIDGWDSSLLGITLEQGYGILSRTGMHCSPMAHKTIGTYPEGTVRISLGYFNNLEQADTFVNAVKGIVYPKG